LNVRFPLVILLVSTSLALLAADTALACSCKPPRPRVQYRQADAAFVGRLLSVHPVDDFRAVFRYRVERSYKRRLGRIVRVRSNLQGTACGLSQEVGRRVAMFLYRSGGKWTSSSCSQISPADLKRAAATHNARARTGQASCS
jgi:hypothetical protein